MENWITIDWAESVWYRNTYIYLKKLFRTVDLTDIVNWFYCRSKRYGLVSMPIFYCFYFVDGARIKVNFLPSLFLENEYSCIRTETSNAYILCQYAMSFIWVKNKINISRWNSCFIFIDLLACANMLLFTDILSTKRELNELEQHLRCSYRDSSMTCWGYFVI